MINSNKSRETPGTQKDRNTFVHQVHRRRLFISGSRGFVCILRFAEESFACKPNFPPAITRTSKLNG